MLQQTTKYSTGETSILSENIFQDAFLYENAATETISSYNDHIILHYFYHNLITHRGTALLQLALIHITNVSALSFNLL